MRPRIGSISRSVTSVTPVTPATLLTPSLKVAAKHISIQPNTARYNPVHFAQKKLFFWKGFPFYGPTNTFNTIITRIVNAVQVTLCHDSSFIKNSQLCHY